MTKSIIFPVTEIAKLEYEPFSWRRKTGIAAIIMRISTIMIAVPDGIPKRKPPEQ